MESCVRRMPRRLNRPRPTGGDILRPLPSSRGVVSCHDQVEKALNGGAILAPAHILRMLIEEHAEVEYALAALMAHTGTSPEQLALIIDARNGLAHDFTVESPTT